MKDMQGRARERLQSRTRESVADKKGEGVREGFCGNCGSPVHAGADICENCMSWLLPGQCVFCYTKVSPKQAFCGECGNPPLGKTCSCGTLSIFDFCPSCAAPLTRQALAEIEDLRTHPAIHGLSESQVEVGSARQTKSVSVSQGDKLRQEPAQCPQEGAPTSPMKGVQDEARKENETRKLKSVQEAPEKNLAPSDAATLGLAENSRREQDRSSKPSATQDPQGKGKLDLLARLSAGIKRADRAAERIEAHAERERLERKRLSEAIAAAQKKEFASRQEARCHLSALTVVVSFRMGAPIAWTCNAFGCTHPYPPGPNECGDPSKGGTWVYRGDDGNPDTVADL